MFLLICALQVAAQEIGTIDRIIPAAPTSADEIIVFIYSPSDCARTFTTVVTGNVVRTDAYYYSCGGPSLGPLPFVTGIGRLPAGTYTYQVYYRFDEGLPTTPTFGDEWTIVVTAAAVAVPALGATELLLLAVSIAVVGFMALRRTIG